MGNEKRLSNEIPNEKRIVVDAEPEESTKTQFDSIKDKNKRSHS